MITSRGWSFPSFKWINDNAYKLDLPSEYNVSATFNVSNLSPFDAGDDFRGMMRLREKLSQAHQMRYI